MIKIDDFIYAIAEINSFSEKNVEDLSFDDRILAILYFSKKYLPEFDIVDGKVIVDQKNPILKLFGKQAFDEERAIELNASSEYIKNTKDGKAYLTKRGKYKAQYLLGKLVRTMAETLSNGF